MVLQDKYKARASAKYRATHGMAPKERGRGQGRGRGRGRGRGGLAHGRPVPQGGSGSGGNGSDQEGTDEEGEEIQGEANEQAEFPTLRAAATHHAATPPKTEEELAAEEETKAERRKYSRRPLQSNAWRFEQLQADSTPQDPRLATEEQQQEPEPEEDLTELLEKIKRLDTSKQELDDGIFARRRSKKPEQPTTVDPAELEHRKQEIEQDIDHELDYLKDRKQARAQAHAKRAIRNDGGNRNAATTRKVLTKEEMQKELEILAEIEKNKQHAEHLRSLKARFTGRSLGERDKKQAKQLNLSHARPEGGAGQVTSATVHQGIDKRSIGTSAAAKDQAPRSNPPTAVPQGPVKVEDAEDFLDSIL